MILKGDAKQLEWRSYIEWSNDPIGIAELHNPKIDIHADNQKHFKLPSRLISKVFLFRWIYRGSAFAFANDADFIPTSSSVKFWQRAIDAANDKYKVLYEFQNEIIDRASAGEVITIPSGREYQFEMKQKGHYFNNNGSVGGGEWYYNIRDIVNWPNQGYSADLLVIARISLRNRIRKLQDYKDKKIKLFNTVHDDIQLDVDNNPTICYNTSILVEKVFADIPQNFEKIYGRKFKVPLAGEVSYGPNLVDLTEFTRELGEKQFYAN